jgi:hypothetical protein
MHTRSSAILPVLAGLVIGCSYVRADEALSRPPLSFDLQEGRNFNSLLRAGPVAAHLVLRSGVEPRIVVAFPAGNSGVGVWFARTDHTVSWTLQGQPEPVVDHDDQGRTLYGIAARAVLTGATDLTVRQAILSSVRVLRAYQSHGSVPKEVLVEPNERGNMLVWERDRLDGAPGYRLSLEVISGRLLNGRRLEADPNGRIALKLVALSGETPLTPFTAAELLNARARPDRATRNTLVFLSYREKFLAGSWRFNTYFGRDTLMSVELLMPVLQPAAIETGLDSVLARLSADGEVAHEEDVGEFAVLDHMRADGSRSDAPVFNYSMIDGDFMLAPVARQWLLDDDRGRSRAAAFLGTSDGRPRLENVADTAAGFDLVRNLRFVIASATAFADEPNRSHLIGLKPGHAAGEWRDSNEGLGGGRYPYDVNAVLVPAALASAAKLFRSGLLDPYLTVADRALLSRAGSLADIWRAKAPALFEVQESNASARAAVKTYAERVGVAPEPGLASLGTEPVRFHALALNADETPVRVVHSDEGFALLFTDPPPTAIDAALAVTMRPFPAGLLTGVGMVVANPVFATAAVQAQLDKSSYHGTVIWSWQQAMLAEGIDRQLRRRDLPETTLRKLRDAGRRLWHVIAAGEAVRNSELWSWTFAGGRFQIAPFGQSTSDVDESNATQLWSTVYLGIAPRGN